MITTAATRNGGVSTLRSAIRLILPPPTTMVSPSAGGWPAQIWLEPDATSSTLRLASRRQLPRDGQARPNDFAAIGRPPRAQGLQARAAPAHCQLMIVPVSCDYLRPIAALKFRLGPGQRDNCGHAQSRPGRSNSGRSPLHLREHRQYDVASTARRSRAAAGRAGLQPQPAAATATDQAEPPDTSTERAARRPGRRRPLHSQQHPRVAERVGLHPVKIEELRDALVIRAKQLGIDLRSRRLTRRSRQSRAGGRTPPRK